jgi:hypothetical protein
MSVESDAEPFEVGKPEAIVLQEVEKPLIEVNSSPEFCMKSLEEGDSASL